MFSLSSRRRTRSAWLAVHRWLGLVLGSLVAVICLSGIAVSYWHEIDRLLHRSFPPLAPSAVSQPLDTMAATAVNMCQGCGPLLEMGPSPAAAVTKFYFAPASRGHVDEIVIDSATGRVLLQRRSADDLVGILYRLHSSLFMPSAGPWCVGLVGVLLTVSLGSGLFLWWPRAGRWRRALSVRPLRRSTTGFLFDLHKTAGVATALVLLVAAVTGVALAFPNATNDLLVRLLPRQPPISLQPRGNAWNRSRPIDSIVSAARQQFPDARWTDLVLPVDESLPAIVTLKQPHERSHYGETKVWVDRLTGTVSRSQDGLRLATSAAVFAYLTPLHSGFALGAVARALFAVIACGPLVLFLTGAWIWGRLRAPRLMGQRSIRRRTDSRRAAPKPVSYVDITADRPCKQVNVDSKHRVPAVDERAMVKTRFGSIRTHSIT